MDHAIELMYHNYIVRKIMLKPLPCERLHVCYGEFIQHMLPSLLSITVNKVIPHMFIKVLYLPQLLTAYRERRYLNEIIIRHKTAICSFKHLFDCLNYRARRPAARSKSNTWKWTAALTPDAARRAQPNRNLFDFQLSPRGESIHYIRMNAEVALAPRAVWVRATRGARRSEYTLKLHDKKDDTVI